MRHVKAFLTASATLALAALAFGQPARAADDLGSSPVQELMSAIGLGDKEKPEIEYRERPALVPPSTMQLPPPQQKGAVGQATGQWPLDPDAERRAAKRAEDALPRTETQAYKMDRNPVLPPSEISGRRTADPEGGVAGYRGTTPDNLTPRVTPGELQGHGRAVTASTLPVGVEPERKRLTDPPAGYRATTAEVAPTVSAPPKPASRRIEPLWAEQNR